MNNSGFGKCMENVQNMDMKLNSTENFANKTQASLVSTDTCKAARYIDGLYIVDFTRKKLYTTSRYM